MSYLRRNDPYSAKAFNEDAGRIPQAQSLSKKLGTPDIGAPPPARRPSNFPLNPDPYVQGVQSAGESKIPELIATGANSRILSTIIEAGKKKLETQETLINAMPDHDENGRVKSGLRAALEGLAEMFDPRYGLVKDWGEFGARAAGAAGRGIGGAINPAWDEKADKEKARVKFRADYEQYSKDADAEVNRAAKQAQIENMETDNQFQRDKFKSQEEQAAEKAKQTSRRDFYRRNQYFDPTKATEAQIKELAKFGETPFSIGHYDVTKPNVKVMNGVSFVWNPATRSFEESNIPKDASKSIVEYKVKDPDTDVEYTYATTQEKAASLKTQLLSAGLSIQAASERQTSQQQFTQKENEKNRAIRTKEFQATYGMAQERLSLARQNYDLAIKKYEADVASGGKSESSKLERDRAKIALVNARSAIQKDLIMTNEEKQRLYDLLPNLDEQ